ASRPGEPNPLFHLLKPASGTPIGYSFRDYLFMAMNMSIIKPEASAPLRTLIADDQPDVLEALRLLLKGEGFLADAVTSPNEVIEAIKARDYDILLMDLNYARDTTSGQEGLDLLTRVQA